jgi:MSHA biogenesis protein MshN
MSLINKMLQDLDARGGAGAARNATGDVRPVAGAGSSRRAIAIGAGIGVLIVAIGGGGWYYVNGRPAAPVASVAPAAAPMPAAAPAAQAAQAAATPAAPAPAPAPAPADVAAAEAAPGPTTLVAPTAPAAEAAPAPAAARPARASRPAERVPAPATPARPAPAAEPASQAGALTSRQQGENAYRRALAALQEGRVTEGIAALEQAVHVYPRHEAARQTLVGLLIENGQADEAIRHARLALALDANQPQLAMVLARLQLERGGPADETLLRSLPYAANNADYIAFLAGVLQKQGRHAQAAEQYEAALRLRPDNGVWWMGLGMARQGQNLRTNAREAYLKAREAGLSPELQAFVERRLGQLQ